MSRSYAKIKTSLWQSKKFRSLIGDDRARLLYAYLHSCTHVNSVGCYSLPIGYVTHDIGWGAAQVLAAMDRLIDAGLITWNKTEDLVRIVGFIEQDPPTNPKHLYALKAVARGLSDCAEKLAVIKDLQAHRFGADDADLTAMSDSLSKAYTEGSPITLPLPSPSPLPEPSQPTVPAGAGRAGDKDPEFEEFWRAYKSPPNSKKPEARFAWKSTAKTRPPLPELLRAVAAYNSWLAEESRKQKRDYPKQHPSTWLRGEVWNGYLTPAADPEAIASAMDRADRLLKRGKYDPQNQASA